MLKKIIIIIIIIICIIIIKNKKAAANVNEMLVATVAECRRIYGVILNLFVQGVLYTASLLSRYWLQRLVAETVYIRFVTQLTLIVS